MFDEDSLFVRAFGWFATPALLGVLGWLLVWIAGAGMHGAVAYAALGAAVANMRAAYGWPPNNKDWAPLAGLIWPLVVARDIIPHILSKPAPEIVPVPAEVETNVAFLDPPRPRRAA